MRPRFDAEREYQRVLVLAPDWPSAYAKAVSRGDQTSSEDPIIIIDTGIYDPNTPEEKPPEP